MKKLMSTIAVLLFAVVVFAQSEIPSAKPGVEYGAGVAKGEAVNFDKLNKHLSKSKSYEGIIEGKVLSVCKKKGCFMTIDNGGDQPIMVRFKDYGFFMPQDMVGKTVVMDGKAVIKTESVEALRQHAQDAGKSAEEIAKIKEPKVSTEILAKGVRVIN
jgi:hypothetical protein